MDQNIKQQIVETINGTTNVLVTVNSNPSVDQLAACIGLTLVLNKLGKHATAVFSGQAPSTIEFLQPNATLEKNTNSLRDFIIALDKSKADKLRYKVEDKVVKIFITPYKTSISQADLEFSEGDFNVDVVMALGVHKREELDKAIMAHGRILHDATVICINSDQASNLGVYNWQDPQASSLCEMVVDLAETIHPDNFDAQTATALLTGIVAQTERFSNTKTTPRTMSLSAKLMAAGANQQLVASKLQTSLKPEQVAIATKPKADEEDSNGTLRIDHPEEATKKPPKDEPDMPLSPLPTPPSEPDLSSGPASSHINDVKTSDGTPSADSPLTKSPPSPISKITTEPPVLGGTLTANSAPEPFESTTDALSLPTPVNQSPILSHGTPKVGSPSVNDDQTLASIEQTVDSPHAKSNAAPAIGDQTAKLDELRSAVDAATQQGPARIEPLAAVGSQPLDLNVQTHNPTPNLPPQIVPADPGLPQGLTDSPTGQPLPPPPAPTSSTPPPPVPPPFMPNTPPNPTPPSQ